MPNSIAIHYHSKGNTQANGDQREQTTSQANHSAQLQASATGLRERGGAEAEASGKSGRSQDADQAHRHIHE